MDTFVRNAGIDELGELINEESLIIDKLHIDNEQN